MTPVSNYLVRRDAQQYGPYTYEVLQLYYKQGQILKTDLVWTSTFESWITVAELFGGASLDAAPPPDIAAPKAETTAPPRPRGSLKPWVWGASAAIVVAVLIVFAALLSGPKPEASLDHARAAYLQRDQANFDKYVDVASVLSDGIDQIVGLIMQQNNAGGLARIAVQAAVPPLKSIYLPSASRAIDQLIISGTLPQDPQSSSNDPAGTMIAAYVSAALHKVAASALSYQGVESKQISGDNATLNLKVATPVSAQPMVLTVRMRKADGYWRVVAVEDLAGLLRHLENGSANADPANSLRVATPVTPIPADTAAAPAPPAAGDFTAAPDAPASSVARQDASSGEVGPSPTDAPQPAPAPSPPPAAAADDPIGEGGFITPPDHSADAGRN